MNLKKMQTEPASIFNVWIKAFTSWLSPMKSSVLLFDSDVWLFGEMDKESEPTRTGGVPYFDVGRCESVHMWHAKLCKINLNVFSDWNSPECPFHFVVTLGDGKRGMNAGFGKYLQVRVFVEKQVPKNIQRNPPRKILKHLSVLFKLRDSTAR